MADLEALSAQQECYFYLDCKFLWDTWWLMVVVELTFFKVQVGIATDFSLFVKNIKLWLWCQQPQDGSLLCGVGAENVSFLSF